MQIHQPDLAMIKPEMSVKANFLEKRVAGTEQPPLLVPPKAILREGNDSYVWVVRGGVATGVCIVRGHDFDNAVEILRGLRDGDVVIAVPPANLRGDERVRSTTATLQFAE